MLGLKRFGLSQSSLNLIQTLYTDASFFNLSEKQWSSIAPDEREAGPGAGLQRRESRPGEALEGSVHLLGPEETRRTQQKAERLRDVLVSAHTSTRIAAKLLDAYLVFEDGASIFPWVARVPLPST